MVESTCSNVVEDSFTVEADEEQRDGCMVESWENNFKLIKRNRAADLFKAGEGLKMGHWAFWVQRLKWAAEQKELHQRTHELMQGRWLG